MKKANEIKFSVNDINAIKNVSNEMQLFTIPGYVEITIDNENITRQDGKKILNDGRIIEIALNCQIKLQDFIKSHDSYMKVDYGDYWQFIFTRKDDIVYFDIIDIIEKKYVLKDKKIHLKDFLREMLESAQIIEKEILKNPFSRKFSVLKSFRVNMDANLYEAVEQKVFTENEIEEMFKDYFKRDSLSDFVRWNYTTP